ncbi:hypothetical protein SAMN05216252_13621 [Actinacidiphila glaucinigra]|uniref:Uncharacterized protein n=1 Tax=Actinacidiphila glaucinigra TaxID=235986 RepID=A0A239NI44_9ACTN|nr:hypothetical protein SAMN05216252_13621 [Actinacidiphila glaucinigra]
MCGVLFRVADLPVPECRTRFRRSDQGRVLQGTRSRGQGHLSHLTGMRAGPWTRILAL